VSQRLTARCCAEGANSLRYAAKSSQTSNLRTDSDSHRGGVGLTADYLDKFPHTSLIISL